MNDTLVTLVGNAATGVEFRETASGGMARFRFAVTPRRWDRGKQLWTDGHTSFFTVWAWRALALNLSGSVSVGEPLVVHGRLKVREEEREGRRKTFVDIEAVAVGHDLTRGTAAFRRVAKGEPVPAVPVGSSGGAGGPGGGDPWDSRGSDGGGGGDGGGGDGGGGGAGEEGEERAVRRRSGRSTGRQKAGGEVGEQAGGELAPVP
ncbi:single-stranded DNA-binding protein [Streptomyces sp. NPDC059605]|uniref:single-stranded DNA-binding protein n=1 Tax=unclassified Streptomyces TaxID=2593676 RepID=UPI0036CB36AC